MSPFVQNYTAEGEVKQRRIIAAGSADGMVKQATAATDALMGVSGIQGTAGADQRVDVIMDKIQDVEFGGVVAFGDPLTSDAEGRAIKAEPVAGANVRIVGFAMENGGAGVIGKAHIVPQIMQG